MGNTPKTDEELQNEAMSNVPGADPMPSETPPMEEFSAEEMQARQLQNEADLARAREMRMDETVPGGKYVVNGQFVDAEGKPVKSSK